MTKRSSKSSRGTVIGGSEPVRGGIIYRGKDYTQEEADVLHGICREQHVSMDQAIQMMAEHKKIVSNNGADRDEKTQKRST